ncbi:putative methyltransferase YcgJ [Aliiroseovarius pelagivivens]|uniref:Putative methyltransferase YcgJ n=1 Tax=Aliiroseovarius pelagivivens TaxID=1639690 RepID=A0A2R8ASI5_9RHOB|nr:class I SAM-dependent methyltransferase [Aliiroseovarius pelagivivens]SPF79021.1 putative methyltransferase YcgJ [Aliiroseovarius pelagivivens]
MQKAKFWNKIADKYAKGPISDMASYEHKLKLTQDLFHSDMSVLEIACGTGSTAILHAPHVAKYLAVDISERMIEIARAKDGPPNLSFQVADVEDMPLEPGSFDMVQAHSALHLLSDPNAAVEKMYDALKPGGLFVSSTTCVGGIWWLKFIAPIGQALGKVPHLAWFTENGLREMVQDAGFEIIEDWRPEGKITALFLIARKPDS